LLKTKNKISEIQFFALYRRQTCLAGTHFWRYRFIQILGGRCLFKTDKWHGQNPCKNNPHGKILSGSNPPV